jgi:predicted glutamine amidotransferase
MLIYHPKSAEPFTRTEFADFNRRNPHGFGAAWISAADGELRYTKGLEPLDDQWKDYQELLETSTGNIVLHWRLRTSGPVTAKACHPFVANDTTLVFHNGVLDWRSTEDMSDTQCFIADHLEPTLRSRSSGRVTKKLHRSLVKKIGSGNKLALWTAGEKKPRIIGEYRGLWHRGRWYSNTYAWTMPYSAQPAKTVRRAYTFHNADLAEDDTVHWDDEEWVNGMGWLPLLPIKRTGAQLEYAERRAELRKKARKA